MDGAAPAIGNAVLDACGANVLDNPLTPERIWQAMKHNLESKIYGQDQRF
jgi:putative selenate reductase molybdopterin-binding subunit